MVIVSVQVIMSIFGVDIPMGRTTADKQMRRNVFDIIHPYIMSPDDMIVVQVAGDQIKDLWLETFYQFVESNDQLHPQRDGQIIFRPFLFE
jgi:hypothetical protein